MDSILQQITDWLKEMLVSAIMGNLSGMFESVNNQVGEIATSVGMTPANFSPGVFAMVRNISESVIIPIPQAWRFSTNKGFSAFIHPDGVYDDPKGGLLRELLYPKLRFHFQFQNELLLFREVAHRAVFSLNVYSNMAINTFISLANLFDASTVEQCFADTGNSPIPGIKENDTWCVRGHADRLLKIGKAELQIFAKLFDGSNNWKQARLPVIHCKQLLEILDRFAKQEMNLGTIQDSIYTTQMWNETGAQNDDIIERKVQFPDANIQMIYSGPHIGVANPLFKTPRSKCVLKSDYDSIDLTSIPENYLARSIYVPLISDK